MFSFPALQPEPRYSSTTIITSPQTLPVEYKFWTWREAIEVANRAESRATVRRERGRWVVRYRARLVAMN